MRRDITISAELMRRVRKEARREGKRVNQYIMDAVRHYMDCPRIGRTMYWYNPKSGRAEPRYIGVLYEDYVREGEPCGVVATHGLYDDYFPAGWPAAYCKELYPTAQEAEQAHDAEEAKNAKEAADYWRAWWANEKSKKRWPRDEKGRLIRNPDGTFKKK